MISKSAIDEVPNAFLALAVVISSVIVGVGYISGSTPEWIVFKACTALLSVGLMGWLASAILNARPYEGTDEAKGGNVDITLPEAPPQELKEDDPLFEAATADSEANEMTAANTATR